LYC
jgi:hypothetical protein